MVYGLWLRVYGLWLRVEGLWFMVESFKFQGQGSTFYDLHGRKVSNPSKGIYIHNGRKIVV